MAGGSILLLATRQSHYSQHSPLPPQSTDVKANVPSREESILSPHFPEPRQALSPSFILPTDNVTSSSKAVETMKDNDP